MTRIMACSMLLLALNACRVQPTLMDMNDRVPRSTAAAHTSFAPVVALDTTIAITEPPAVSTQTPVKSNDTPTALDPSMPTIKPMQVCSPLKHETVDSLGEIVSDPYNPPPPGRDERHHGVDFAYYQRGERTTIEGEVVQAIMAGRVAAVVKDRLPYGNLVILETPLAMLSDEFRAVFGIGAGESVYQLYAHLLAEPLVQIGDRVECGQALGQVGMTGYNIVNPHLHLETRIGPAGITFDGMAFYTTSATLTEMDNYLRWRTSGEFRHFDPMTLFDWFLGSK